MFPAELDITCDTYAVPVTAVDREIADSFEKFFVEHNSSRLRMDFMPAHPVRIFYLSHSKEFSGQSRRNTFVVRSPAKFIKVQAI